MTDTKQQDEDIQIFTCDAPAGKVEAFEIDFIKNAQEHASNQQELYDSHLGLGTDIIEPHLDLFQLAYFKVNNVWNGKSINTAATVATQDFEIVSKKEGDQLTEERQYACKEFLNEITKGGEFHGDFLEFLQCQAKDFRAIGSMSYEVVKDRAGRPCKLYHMPAISVRKRKGESGFYQLQYVRDNITQFEDGTGRVNTDINAICDFSLLGGGGLRRVYFKEYGDPRSFSIEGREGATSDQNEANEIVQVRDYDGVNHFYGTPEYIPALTHILADESAVQWNLSFFRNYRIPNFIIQVIGKNMQEGEKESIKQYFKTEAHQNKPLVVSIPSPQGKVITERLNDEQKEGEFIKFCEQMRDVILAAHGTPRSLVGIQQAGNLGGKGTDSEQRRNYNLLLVSPLQKKLVKTINSLILPVAGFEDCKVKLKNFNVEDTEEQSQKSKTARENFKTGFITLNEAREILGLPEIDEEFANKHLMILGNQVLDLATMLDGKIEEQKEERDLTSSLSRIKQALPK